MKNKKLFIKSNGCQGRDLDVARLISFFEKNNCKIVANPKNADTIIFLPCSFKESRKDDSFNYIKKVARYKGELIVVGCLPDILPQEFKKKFDGKYLSIKKLDEIDKFFPEFTIKFSDEADANILYPKFSVLFNKISSELKLSRDLLKHIISSKVYLHKGKQVPYLRIGTGCNEKCAYCGIRRAIGPLQSKPLVNCIDEYKNLLKKGYSKIKIYADNIGAYGIDIGSSFAELLQELSKVDEKRKVELFLLHLDPKWALRYKSEILNRIKEKTITEIMCPIQSGSERILALMNRHTGNKDLLECLNDFKDANPELKLYTQIIVGFPTETDDDVFQTIDFIKRAQFDVAIPFQYFDVPGGIASNIDNKISMGEINRRIQIIGYELNKAGIMWLRLPE